MQARSQSDVCLRVCVCLVSINTGERQTKTGRARRMACVCVCVCVSLHCLPQRLTARVKEILHLASINRSALFISHSTNIGYLFQRRPSTLLPCSTLKPDSNTPPPVKTPPHPSRYFPFGPLPHRNTPDQHLITTTPLPRIEAHRLDNKALSGPRYVTPSSVSHLVLLGNALCRSLKGNHVCGS